MTQGKRTGKMVMGAMSARVQIVDKLPVHPIEKYVNDDTREDIEMLEDGLIGQRYIYAHLRENGMTHDQAIDEVLKNYD